MPVAVFARQELSSILRQHPDLLEVWQVADITNSHERTVRRWLASGKLKGLQKSARSFLIPKKCVIDFLTRAATPADE